MSVLEEMRNIGAFTMNTKALELYSLAVRATTSQKVSSKRYSEEVGGTIIEKAKGLVDAVFLNDRPEKGEEGDAMKLISSMARLMRVYVQNAFINLGMTACKAAEFADLFDEFDRSFASWKKYVVSGGKSSQLSETRVEAVKTAPPSFA